MQSYEFSIEKCYFCIKLNICMHTKEETLAAFGRLLDVQERLRKECPWDRKQTFESLRPNTIEEVYELADALMKRDLHNVMKELGDVMEHVIFYSILGKEAAAFDMADVCDQETRKLMFRHPFIDWTGWAFDPKADAEKQGEKPQTAEQMEQTWEQVKQHEKDGNASVLSGVPRSLPSMIKAYRIQDKARNVGFDWHEKEDVWAKVREELSELEAELRREDKRRSTEELGDFIFSVINAARLYHLNPDNALEMTNQKFTNRFNYVEKRAKEMGKELKDMTLEQMDELWNEAKAREVRS